MNGENEKFEPINLPLQERFNISWDFESRIKHIWLTGYILITWEWDYNFWKTLDIAWYSSGSYE